MRREPPARPFGLLGEEREDVDERHTGAAMLRFEPAQQVDGERIGRGFLLPVEAPREWQQRPHGIAPSMAARLEMAEVRVAQLVREDRAQHLHGQASEGAFSDAERQQRAGRGAAGTGGSVDGIRLHDDERDPAVFGRARKRVPELAQQRDDRARHQLRLGIGRRPADAPPRRGAAHERQEQADRDRDAHECNTVGGPSATVKRKWGLCVSGVLRKWGLHPEIPRMVRLVRSVVLSIREEPYVEAALALGSATPALLVRHVLPNTMAPIIVQGTFVCASAILVEAILSFLGVGIPPETPTWGNIMAEGRNLFRIFPHNILFPSVFLAATVLAVNMLGDGLRDLLDPKVRKQI